MADRQNGVTHTFPHPRGFLQSYFRWLTDGWRADDNIHIPFLPLSIPGANMHYERSTFLFSGCKHGIKVASLTGRTSGCSAAVHYGKPLNQPATSLQAHHDRITSSPSTVSPSSSSYTLRLRLVLSLFLQRSPKPLFF